MATAARFAAGDNSPPTPAPASTPPAQSQTTQLIVLPASLHQVILFVVTLLINFLFRDHATYTLSQYCP